MSDVMLSYSTTDWDRASEILRQLELSGLNVWIDDPREDDVPAASIGIPAGMAHWATICEAIDSADSMLVLDTDGWRGSSYCQNEHAYALGQGKWIAMLGEHNGSEEPEGGVSRFSDLTHFIRQRAAYEDALEAHVRLSAMSRHRFPRTSLSGRELLSLRAVTDDINLVLAPSSPVQVTPSMQALIEAYQAARARGVRRFQRRAVAAISILATLAIAAVAGFLIARHSRTVESEQRDYATSLALADQALNDPDTRLAIETADHAVRVDRNFFSLEAAVLTRARAARKRTFTIPALTGNSIYRDLVWSPDESQIWFTSERTLYRLVLATGKVDTMFTATRYLQPGTLVVAPDDVHAAIVTDAGPVVIDSQTNTAHTQGPSDTSALVADGDGLWLATRNGELSRLSHPWTQQWPERAGDWASTPTGIVAMTYDPDAHRLVAVGLDNKLYQIPIDHAPHSDVWRSESITSETTSTPIGIAYPATVAVCDGTIYGSLYLGTGSNIGFSEDPGANLQTAARSIAHAARISCYHDSAVSILLGFGETMTVGATTNTSEPLQLGLTRFDATPLQLASDGRAAYAERSGELVVAEPTLLTQSIDTDKALDAVRLASGTLTLRADGTVEFADGTSDHFIQIGVAAPAANARFMIRDDNSAWLCLSDGQTFLVTKDNVVPTARVDEAGRLSLSSGGTLVVTGKKAVQLVRDEGDARDIPINDLADQEQLVHASVDETTGFGFATTSFGRLARFSLEPGSTTYGITALPAGSASDVVALPEGLVLVGGADGNVAIRDADLHVVRSALLGGPVVALDVHDNEVMVGLASGEVDQLDLADLTKVDILATNVVDASSWQFTSDGQAVFGVTRNIDTGRLEHARMGDPPTITNLNLVPVIQGP